MLHLKVIFVSTFKFMQAKVLEFSKPFFLAKVELLLLLNDGSRDFENVFYFTK